MVQNKPPWRCKLSFPSWNSPLEAFVLPRGKNQLAVILHQQLLWEEFMALNNFLVVVGLISRGEPGFDLDVRAPQGE